MTDISLEVEEKIEVLSTEPSFYTTQETDYLSELAQLVAPYPSGDMPDGIVSVRTFTLSTGKVLLAIVVSELIDSYIAVFPFILHAEEEDSTFSFKRGSYRALCRIHKTVVALSSIPPSEMVFPYLRAIRKYTDELPGFFNESRTTQIDSLLVQLNASAKSEENESKLPSLGDKLGARPGSFTPPEFFEKRVKH